MDRNGSTSHFIRSGGLVYSPSLLFPSMHPPRRMGPLGFLTNSSTARFGLLAFLLFGVWATLNYMVLLSHTESQRAIDVKLERARITVNRELDAIHEGVRRQSREHLRDVRRIVQGGLKLQEEELTSALHRVRDQQEEERQRMQEEAEDLTESKRRLERELEDLRIAASLEQDARLRSVQGGQTPELDSAVAKAEQEKRVLDLEEETVKLIVSLNEEGKNRMQCQNHLKETSAELVEAERVVRYAKSRLSEERAERDSLVNELEKQKETMEETQRALERARAESSAEGDSALIAALVGQASLSFARVAQKETLSVRPFFFTASETPAADAFTVVTQLTAPRMARLVRVARQYGGPVSAVVVVRRLDDEIPHILSAFRKSPSLARYVDLHLVLLAENKKRYPINTLRNIAWDHARSSCVLLLDVDFIPRVNVHEALAKVRASMSEDQFEQTALVLPAFEVPDSTLPSELPKNKRKLQEMMEERKIWVLRRELDACHGATHLDRWLTTSEPYEVEYSYMYEPVVAGLKTMPRFHERFEGYGLDRASQVYKLQAMQFHFVVVPDSFVVHVHHKKAIWRVNDDGEFAWKNWFHFLDDVEAEDGVRIAEPEWFRSIVSGSNAPPSFWMPLPSSMTESKKKKKEEAIHEKGMS